MAQTLGRERSVARARLVEYFRERRRQTRTDGSVDGGLVPTAGGPPATAARDLTP